LPKLDDGFVNDPGLGPEDIAPPPAPGDTPTPARLAALLPSGTTRQPIANPNDFPWCAHVMLLMRAPDDSREVGSGWIIGPRTIITAGHCVYDQGWMRSIEVRPGGPEGGFGSFPAVHYDTTRAWLEGSGEERQKSDLGVVHLRDPIPGHPGPLRYSVYSDDQINSIAPNHLSVAGFPANPFGVFLFDRGTLLDFNKPFLHYDAETSGGMSGAPVVHWASDGIPTVIGIHHFNVRPNVNRGIRIGPAAASLLLTWTH
jgi:V8-like Glu-specific endopeptidase